MLARINVHENYVPSGRLICFAGSSGQVEDDIGIQHSHNRFLRYPFFVFIASAIVNRFFDGLDSFRTELFKIANESINVQRRFDNSLDNIAEGFAC